MSETQIIVEGKALSKEFNGNTVLKDVSIRCEAGRAVALVGENGAGKSTLMNIISGGLAPRPARWRWTAALCALPRPCRRETWALPLCTRSSA